MEIDLDALPRTTPAETVRRKWAQQWTWRTADRVSYETGLLCQRAGLRYRGPVTPAERAAVDALTLSERVGDTVSIMRCDPLPAWPYISDEEARFGYAVTPQNIYAELFASLAVWAIVLILLILCLPIWLAIGLRQRIGPR